MITWNFKRGAWTSTMSPCPSKNTIPLKRSALSSCGKEGVEGKGGVDEGVGGCVNVGVCVGTGDGRGKGKGKGWDRGVLF